jgi:hypothetical protein
MTGNFAAAGLTMGQLNAGVKIIGGKEKFESLLRGETMAVNPDSLWSERNGMVYFLTATDGTTGPEWIERLESEEFAVSYNAKEYLNSSLFKPSNGVLTVGVLVRASLVPMEWSYLSPKDIRRFAAQRNLKTPSVELGLLAIEKFPRKYQKRMGLDRIVAMHAPINVGKPYRQNGELLATSQIAENEDWLTTESSGHVMYERDSFVFEVSRF